MKKKNHTHGQRYAFKDGFLENVKAEPIEKQICECGWHECYHGEKDIILSDFKGSPKEHPCKKFKLKKCKLKK